MDTKIGSIFYRSLIAFLALFCSVIISDSSIELLIKDTQGRIIKEVGTSIPFVIEVNINSNVSIKSVPDLSIPQEIILEKNPAVSTIHATINGLKSIKKIYRYQGFAQKEGILRVGPAFFQENGKRYESNVINLTVSANLKTVHEEAFLTLTPSKDTLFKGEPFEIKLRFYAQNGVQLQGISTPDLSKFKAKPLGEPIVGTEVIEGVSYGYAEWQIKAIPLQEGSITIPPVRAIYTSSKNINRHRSFGFDFFDNFIDRQTKEVYSSAKTVTVNALPIDTHSISAMGLFHHMHASIDKYSARVGEAIILRIAVEGQGDVEGALHPNLILPDGLTYYESTAQITPLPNNHFKKEFEYIVQAKNPGAYIIPEQSFSFFDYEHSIGKTLKTLPLLLSITGSAEEKSLEEVKDPKQIVVSQETLWPLVQDNWFNYPQRYIPWVYFFGLIICIMLASLLYAVLNHFSLKEQVVSFFKEKNNFNRTLKMIKTAQKNNDEKMLYNSFTTFLHNKMGNSFTEKHLSILIEKKYGLEKQREWHDFWIELNEYYFTQKSHQVSFLFEKAEKWIYFLNELL